MAKQPNHSSKAALSSRLGSLLTLARQNKRGGSRERKVMRLLQGKNATPEAKAWAELVLAVMRGDLDQRTLLGLSSDEGLQIARHGAFLLEHGDTEAALAAGKLAVAHAPNHALAWHLLGDALALKGKDIEALVALQKARELAPNNPRVHVDLAEVHLARIEYRAAIDCLKQARALDPNGESPAGRRAQVLIVETLVKLEGA